MLKSWAVKHYQLQGSGPIVIPFPTRLACGITLKNKLIIQKTITKHINNEKYYERAQQTINLFDKLYRKGVKDNIIDNRNFESL